MKPWIESDLPGLIVRNGAQVGSTGPMPRRTWRYSASSLKSPAEREGFAGGLPPQEQLAVAVRLPELVGGPPVLRELPHGWDIGGGEGLAGKGCDGPMWIGYEPAHPG